MSTKDSAGAQFPRAHQDRVKISPSMDGPAVLSHDEVMDRQWLLRHRPAVLILAAGSPLLLCAIVAQFRDSVTPATAALGLVLVVVAFAATGDRYAGVAAAVSGGAWFDYFLTAPFNRFAIEDPDDVEVAVLLVLVGLAVTELTLWGSRQQANASNRTGYLDGVMATAQIMAGQFSSAALADHVAAQITGLLDVDSCRFVAKTTLPPQSAVLDADGEVTARGAKINIDRDGLPTMEETVLQIQYQGVIFGHFLITAATRVVRPSLEQRRVAALLAYQVGTAYAADAKR